MSVLLLLRTFLLILLGRSVDMQLHQKHQAVMVDSTEYYNSNMFGDVKTWKHLLLLWVIKTLTKSRSNQNTALCIYKMTAVDIDDVPFPSNVH